MAYQLTTAKIWDGAAWVDAAGGLGALVASGGTEVTSGGYKYHTFTSSNTLTVTKAGLCEVLIVAGGGAGGSGGTTRGQGGGGAGGVIGIQNVYLTEGSHTVTVGAGGAAVSSFVGQPGNTSRIDDYKVPGGGGGGSENRMGQTGACGGGNGDRNATPPYVQSLYGYRGGKNDGSTNDGGAGGGGMGAQGADVTGGSSGVGGAGINTFSTWASATSTGDSGYYGGGGGGSGNNTSAVGGIGGGGNANAGAGDANTGGGGGGQGGNGGSGLVIVRYVI